MGARMRALDWSATALGEPASWPQSLAAAVGICLNTQFPIAIYWGPELTLLYNDAWSSIPGEKHPWALGRRGREVWPEIWGEIGPLFERVQSSGEGVWQEDQLLPMHRHGYTEECYFNFTFSPIRDADGQVAGIFNAVVETTFRVIEERRNQVLQQLAERTLGGRSVVEVCRHAAGVLDAGPADVPFALFYSYQPHGQAQLVARCGATLPAELCRTQLPVAELHRLWRAPDASASGPQVVPLPGTVLGSAWPEQVQAAVVLSFGSPAAGLCVAGVSPRRALDPSHLGFFNRIGSQLSAAIHDAQAYEAERRRAESLAEIDRAKTAFFSNVSHEFRTPLTLMLGPLQEAVENPATPLQIRTQLELAHRNSLRLLKLVNSLLDFSRLEAGRVQATYEPTDLAALTRDLASTFRSAVERAGLQFEVDCALLGAPVYVDRDMWEKIVLNLISNAFKFTLQGRIVVVLRQAGPHAVLEVSDTGVGIPEQELPRLFERFHRVEGTAGRTQEGSGIGLALVQELVKLHGGTIAARSRVAQGTTMRVELPLGTVHLPAERIRAPTGRVSTAIGAQAFVQEALRWLPDGSEGVAPGPLQGLTDAAAAPGDHRFASTFGARIVLADDNADMRTYVRDLLAAHYHVEAVPDGRAALEAIRAERPELVLTDMMMPHLDGFGLLQALRSDENLREIPVILLSARAGEESRLEGLDAGADDYLVKPFSARELLVRIGALIELTRMRRESDERFRAFVSATSDAIYRMSPDWSVMHHLQGRSFMADTHAPSARWLEQYIPPEEQPRVVAHIRAAIQSKRSFQLEHRVRRVDGSLGWTFSRAVPILDAKGEIREWFGAASDVTERKRAEEALRDADRRKDVFLATLSHELRNPLAPIRSAAELLAHPGLEGRQLSWAQSVIQRQVRHMAWLLDDLLDVSRITQGKLTLRRERVRLASVIDSAVEAVRPLLERKGHRLVVTLPAESVQLDGDPLRLSQVLSNLLNNAAKYTDPGGRIELTAAVDVEQLRLTVKDTGIGLSAAALPTLFEMFAQIENGQDRAEGGLGIGLALVKGLVQLHGGSVEAHSEGVDRGSTFTVCLPLAAGRDVSAEGHGEVVPGVARGRRVLVVDDNRDAADALAMVLGLSGHEVRAAYDGVSALALAPAFRPEVALLDIGMPGMNGYALARSLRAEPWAASLVLIAVTGWGQDSDHARAAAAGFDEHLTKPVDPSRIESLVSGLRQ